MDTIRLHDRQDIQVCLLRYVRRVHRKTGRCPTATATLANKCASMPEKFPFKT